MLKHLFGSCSITKVMFHISLALSGEPLASFNGDEVEGDKSVKSLKRHLAKLIGVSRFRQRWFSEDHSELHDKILYVPPSKIQLVIMDFLAGDEQTQQDFFSACSENRKKDLEAILQQPLTPNIIDYSGHTALHVAALAGHLEVVQLLLEAGIDKDTVTPLGRTALEVAVEQSHLQIVQFLLDAGAKRERIRHPCMASYFLRAAAKSGHVELARWSLESGANIDKLVASFGNAPLHLAALFGHIEVVQLLLQAGADKHKVTEPWNSEFHLADNYPVMAQLSMEADAVTPPGKTALDLAVENNHMKVQQLLLGR